MTQASFRLVRKGYEPSEVDQRVAQLSASIQQLQSDLARAHDDNAVQAVENTKLRQANSDLAGRIEMLEQAVQEVRDERDNGVPPTFANLGGRIGQMLTLAQEEADELRSTAQAEAEKLTADTKQQAADALAAAQQEAGELRSRAEADAARTIEDAKQQADHLRESADGEATARLEEAEAVYEAQRAQAAAAAADFEQTLAERRAEAMNELNSALEKKTTEVEFATDEQPGKSDITKIPTLKPAFKKDGTVTAASSSSISDGAAATGRVAVRDLAVVDDGHGLETPVRVRADAAPLGGRLEHHRAAVVKHEEGRERGGVVVVREQGAHGKTVADPVALRVALDE